MQPLPTKKDTKDDKKKRERYEKETGKESEKQAWYHEGMYKRRRTILVHCIHFRLSEQGTSGNKHIAIDHAEPSCALGNPSPQLQSRLALYLKVRINNSVRLHEILPKKNGQQRPM